MGPEWFGLTGSFAFASASSEGLENCGSFDYAPVGRFYQDDKYNVNINK